MSIFSDTKPDFYESIAISAKFQLFLKEIEKKGIQNIYEYTLCGKAQKIYIEHLRNFKTVYDEKLIHYKQSNIITEEELQHLGYYCQCKKKLTHVYIIKNLKNPQHPYPILTIGICCYKKLRSLKHFENENYCTHCQQYYYSEKITNDQYCKQCTGQVKLGNAKYQLKGKYYGTPLKDIPDSYVQWIRNFVQEKNIKSKKIDALLKFQDLKLS
jgi:uncharacterized protein (DUF3820 family)